jgi:putative endonuclease
MYIVYVLEDASGRLYKGMTNNLDRRLAEHIAGGTRTTRRMDGLKVVYQERHATSGEARRRELYLKSAAGRRYLKKKLMPG